jgi:predicted transcriptional regulator of viral defense system
MNQISKLKQLSNLSYFGTSTLWQIYPDLSRNSLYSNIKRWIEKGDLIQLKKGLYVTKEYINNTSDINRYKEFIANNLKYPSYLSLEYVLQKYSILSEAIYAYTSITLKTKNRYENDLGRYIYRGISKDLFIGYTIQDRGEYTIKEATKSKALFDYLYLKLYRSKNITESDLLSFRLNIEQFNETDLQEFQQYCILTGQKKFKKLKSLIIKAYDI